MTSWHYQIILISFQFNYGKTSGIWRFRLIASSPPIALGRSPPEVKKKKNSPPLLQIRPRWNLSACFFTRESIRLYVLLSHGTSNSIAKLWELRKQISEQSKPKRSIEEHDKYSIDWSCATPETWILLIKTHAHTTLCSFDLFPTSALHCGVAFHSIIQGQRMEFARDYQNLCIAAFLEVRLMKVSSHARSVYWH